MWFNEPMIEPGTYNFTIYQGATWDRTFTVATDGTPVSWVGYNATLTVKRYDNSAAVLTLTNGSGITLGGTAGTIAVTMSPTQTDSIPAGRYVYDLELSLGGGAYVTRILQGRITVDGQVTK